jgi:hypothetical protein
MRNLFLSIMLFIFAFLADIKYRFVKYEKAKGSSLTQEERNFVTQEAWQQANTQRPW